MDSNVGAFVIDIMILAWLVGTWFYEGHHRRCKVEVTCGHCGKTSQVGCQADHRRGEEDKGGS